LRGRSRSSASNYEQWHRCVFNWLDWMVVSLFLAVMFAIEVSAMRVAVLSGLASATITACL
jgi:hypothetical protein